MGYYDAITPAAWSPISRDYLSFVNWTGLVTQRTPIRAKNFSRAHRGQAGGYERPDAPTFEPAVAELSTSMTGGAGLALAYEGWSRRASRSDAMPRLGIKPTGMS